MTNFLHSPLLGFLCCLSCLTSKTSLICISCAISAQVADPERAFLIKAQREWRIGSIRDSSLRLNRTLWAELCKGGSFFFCRDGENFFFTETQPEDTSVEAWDSQSYRKVLGCHLMVQLHWLWKLVLHENCNHFPVGGCFYLQRDCRRLE